MIILFTPVTFLLDYVSILLGEVGVGYFWDLKV